MSKITVTNYRCDVCGNIFPEELQQNEDESFNRKAQITHYSRFPVIFYTDQTEGRPSDPYISFEKIDICNDCLHKAIRLTGRGAQGNNTYTIE